MFTFINNEKGVVLVIALMILALLTVLSLTAVLTTTTDMEISTNYRASQSTFYNNEGSMDIAAGTVRRTIELKNSTFAGSLGILDTNDDGRTANNGISDTDEAGTDPLAVINIPITDTDGNGTADFAEAIMGVEGVSAPQFTVRVDLNNNGAIDRGDISTTVTTTRRNPPVQLKGFSTGFATGYEGGAMTGRGIDFTMTGDTDSAVAERNSQSSIQLVYRCIERSGGGCL